MAFDRQYLNATLSKAIIERDLEVVHALFNVFNLLEIDFDYIDDEGNSFLFLAIERKLKSIVVRLFELQKNHSDIIFGKNNQGETLVYCAAKSGYTDMLLTLIAEAKSKGQHWLLADNL